MQRNEENMTDNKFIELTKAAVRDYANTHYDPTDEKKITEDDVYIVWYCKTLQNWKALASTNLPDGMYYEITLNGDKNEYYLDAYKKFENKRIQLVKEDNRCSANKTSLCTHKVFDANDVFCSYCGSLTTYALEKENLRHEENSATINPHFKLQ